MKVSELTAGIIKDFCGISDEDSDDIIAVLISSSKAYIRGYTNLTDEEIDGYEDITYACMVLANEMYSQRDYTVSTHRQVSPTVKNILNMYAKNHVG